MPCGPVLVTTDYHVRDPLEAALPGYPACFDKLWQSPIHGHLLRHFATAEQVRTAGLTTL